MRGLGRRGGGVREREGWGEVEREDEERRSHGGREEIGSRAIGDLED